MGEKIKMEPVSITLKKEGRRPLQPPGVVVMEEEEEEVDEAAGQRKADGPAQHCFLVCYDGGLWIFL